MAAAKSFYSTACHRGSCMRPPSSSKFESSWSTTRASAPVLGSFCIFFIVLLKAWELMEAAMGSASSMFFRWSWADWLISALLMIASAVT